MSWQLLIFVSILSYALAILSQRVLMKDDNSEPVSYSIFFQLFTGIIIALFGLLTSDMNLPDLKPLLLNILLMVLLYGFGNIFVFSAIKLVEASEFSIIFASRGLFTILASSILINEGLKKSQIFGAILIMLAVIFVTIKSTKFSLSKGEFFALLAAGCMGIAVTNDRHLLNYFSVYPYVSLAFILPAIFIGFLNPKKTIKINVFLKKQFVKKMFFMCIFYSISAITFFSALQISTNSSQIASLNLLSIILVVILSTLFLKERDFILRKIIGAILGFVGAILVNK